MVILTSSRHLAISGDIFYCHNLEDELLDSKIEPRDAAKYPAMHRTALHNKELPTSVNSAKIEKLCPTLTAKLTKPRLNGIYQSFILITLKETIVMY